VFIVLYRYRIDVYIKYSIILCIIFPFGLLSKMKKEKQTLKIREILNRSFAVGTTDGDNIYNQLKELMGTTEESIIIDFEGIELTSTAFLHTALGQLYKDYPQEQFLRIEIVNIQPNQLQLLNRILNTALHYYNNRETFNNSAKKHFEK